MEVGRFHEFAGPVIMFFEFDRSMLPADHLMGVGCSITNNSSLQLSLFIQRVGYNTDGITNWLTECVDR